MSNHFTGLRLRPPAEDPRQPVIRDAVERTRAKREQGEQGEPPTS